MKKEKVRNLKENAFIFSSFSCNATCVNVTCPWNFLVQLSYLRLSTFTLVIQILDFQIELRLINSALTNQSWFLKNVWFANFPSYKLFEYFCFYTIFPISYSINLLNLSKISFKPINIKSIHILINWLYYYL